jgi:hypothetical protein
VSLKNNPGKGSPCFSYPTNRLWLVAGSRRGQLLRAMQIDWEVVNMAISLYLCRCEANR